MIHVTKTNFEEIIKGEAIIAFMSKTGCGFCTQFKPIYEDFDAHNPTQNCGVYERESLNSPLDEIEKKYGIQSFPTILKFKDGQVLGKIDTYMFMNLETLGSHVLDQEIELAKKRKSLYELESRIGKMKAHVKSLMENKPEEVKPVSPAIDYSQFPESPEAPCDGCQ